MFSIANGNRLVGALALAVLTECDSAAGPESGSSTSSCPSLGSHRQSPRALGRTRMSNALLQVANPVEFVT